MFFVRIINLITYKFYTFKYWWPYKGPDENGVEQNGKFRKAKVIRAKTCHEKHLNKKEIKTLKSVLLEDVHVPKSLFDENNWENIFDQVKYYQILFHLNLLEKK